jgi:hypothetical protein
MDSEKVRQALGKSFRPEDYVGAVNPKLPDEDLQRLINDNQIFHGVEVVTSPYVKPDEFLLLSKEFWREYEQTMAEE